MKAIIEILPYRVNPSLFATPKPCLCFPWGAHTPCCNYLSAYLSSKLVCDLEGSYCMNSIRLIPCVPSTVSANNHCEIECILFPLEVYFSRLANPSVYSWKHYPTSHIFFFLNWGVCVCGGEGYLDKSMYLHFVGEVLIISNPQESATDLAKVNKGSRAITSQTWKGLIYCLHFFKNNNKKR